MMIVKLYRKLIPADIRNYIYKVFLGSTLKFSRELSENLKCMWYCIFYSIIPPKTDKAQSLRDWGRVGPSPYPYLWKEEYDRQDYDVHTDVNTSLSYVYHNGKKLYFKKGMKNIADAYRGLLIEQDERSAHRYVESYQELKGKVLLDVGAAEAIFTLDVIEYVNHAYLFECDESWIDALNATFDPWKDKITIVRKYVSDVDDENNITLDTFFEDKQVDNIFIKMDIEGYERKALQGCKNIFSKKQNLSGSVCIYHLSDDESVIQKILDMYGCKTSIQPGFLYFEKAMRHAIMRFES